MVGAEKTEGRESSINKDSWRSKARGPRKNVQITTFSDDRSSQ